MLSLQEKMHYVIVRVFQTQTRSVNKIALPTLATLAAQKLTQDDGVLDVIAYAIQTHILSSPAYTVIKGKNGGVSLRQPDEG